ncbi:tetratricopeptide repeat protein [Saccharopolyspora sp. 5N708]|uniref:tetratricopeptide repeat protein n=1 Tax=Saccharopolyspora sp. 5N708 TaxID=3457424 RepID=UPI003FD33EF7
MVVGQGSSTPAEPEPWHVRIFDVTANVVLGSGVLLGGRQVLTCAHVANACEPDRLRVDFPFNAERDPCGVQTVRGSDGSSADVDLSLLDLAESQPESWSAPLAATPGVPRDSVVWVYGHPKDGTDSRWVRLQVAGPTAQGRVQLDADPHARVVVPGFSGAAVCANDNNAVLGIVAMTDPNHSQGLAWMIPIETIREHLPVQEFLVAEPPRVSRRRRFGQLETRVEDLRDAEIEAERQQYASRRVSPVRPLAKKAYALRMQLTGLRRQEHEAPGSVPLHELEALERTVEQALDVLALRRRRWDELIDQPESGVTTCRRPGCSGEVEETGFCDTCGRRPESRRVPQSAIPNPSDHWTCANLIELPVLDFPDPGDRIIRDPRVPEHERFCGKCGWAVGRATPEKPGLDKGFCPHCRTPFSFVPSLRNGEWVGNNRYRVLGYLAHGGYGWIYLAEDTNLHGRYVALKALIDQQGEHAAAELLRELQYLTKLDHPNLVRALDSFRHQAAGEEPTDYIVMEYVEGVQLAELPEFQQRVDTGAALPRIAEIAAYGCEILAVCEYLHQRDLLYTDMKPENVIRSRDRIKIIDLGGIRPVNDQVSAVLTSGFHVPWSEIEQYGLSVGSDLYSVAKTLKEMARWGTDGGAELDSGIESFHCVLDRALQPDRQRRFASAEEMADQLKAVLREILSLRDHRARHEASRYFQPIASLFDAGLGVVPPLETWTRQGGALRDFGRPSPEQVALDLPRPNIDPADPYAGYLARVSGSDPGRITGRLPESPESRLLECRIRLASDVDGAQRCLEQAREFPTVTQWRLDWHAGLIALVRDQIAVARRHFERVHAVLPGEMLPKVAMGFCWEQQDRVSDARRCFEAAWWRDAAPAYAAFGLARMWLAEGQRAEAVRVLDEVPEVSRHYDAARIAAVRALTTSLGDAARPTAEDFRQAARRLRDLELDDAAAHRRLTTSVQQAAFDWLKTAESGEVLHRGGEILGDPPDEPTLRDLLAESFSALAEQARDADEHDALMDGKNTIRRVTWW